MILEDLFRRPSAIARYRLPPLGSPPNGVTPNGVRSCIDTFGSINFRHGQTIAIGI